MQEEKRTQQDTFINPRPQPNGISRTRSVTQLVRPVALAVCFRHALVSESNSSTPTPRHHLRTQVPRRLQLVGELCLRKDRVAGQPADPPRAVPQRGLVHRRDAAVVAPVTPNAPRVTHDVAVILEALRRRKVQPGEGARFPQEMAAPG